MPHHPASTKATAALLRTLDRTGAPPELIARLWTIRGLPSAERADALAQLHDELAAVQSRRQLE